MPTNRKLYNLAKAKLALYEKYHSRLRHYDSKIRLPNTTQSPSGKYKQAQYRARKYYRQMLTYYHAISLPLDEQNETIKKYLATCDSRARSVYVMRTGFGKGISFQETQIARILKISGEKVRELFAQVNSGLVTPFEKPNTIGVRDLIADISKLTPEFISYLQSHEEEIDLVTWHLYEQLVAEFFASWRYDVSLVGRNASTSADIIAIRPPDASGISLRCLIEVKKLKKKIGIEAINAVLGSIYSEQVNRGFHVGVIVSHSGFRELQKIPPQSLNYLGIELRDGDDVKRWLREYSPSNTGLWLSV